MNTPKLKPLFFALLLSFVMTQVAVAQQKPKVFFSDDFLLDNTSAPNYLWFYGDHNQEFWKRLMLSAGERLN